MANALNGTKRWTVSIALGGFAALLTACCCPTPTETPTPPPPTREEPPTEVLDPLPAWCKPLVSSALATETAFGKDAAGLYWDHQVIVSGTPDEIDRVLARIERLDPIDEVRTETLSSSGLPGVVIRLYAIADPATPVPTVILGILAAAAELQVPVFADPNYVTHSPIVEGAPHSISGSPLSAASVAVAADMFWEQWAFTADYGVGLLSSHERLVTQTGAATSIAVFDTSPLAEEGLWHVRRANHQVDLCVSLPESAYFDHVIRTYSDRVVAGAPHSISGSPVETAGEGAIDHGLFVAGLAQAVASASRIHLIRVLDHKAEGDLFTLIKGLSLSLEQGDTRVINLSLTLALKDQERFRAVFGQDAEAATTLLNDLIKNYFSQYGTFDPNNEVAITALRIPLLAATAQGLTTAAASGNDSLEGEVQPPGYPSLWGLSPVTTGSFPLAIIGVGASNIQTTRSCYSNEANVLAPGGDGMPPDCRGATDDCADPFCEYGLISLLTSVRSPNTGYGSWAGTSFSTPFVSGLTALVLEKCSALSPSEVAARIAGLNSALRVLSIPNTLAPKC